MMTDPIADMLTRIRNSSAVNKTEVAIPYSKLKVEVAGILEKSGYILGSEKIEEGHPELIIRLKYKENKPAIKAIIMI